MTSKQINNPMSGFYYDEQVNNKLTMVTLHANTEEDGPPRYSKPWSGTKEKDAPNQYGEDPIARSVINEDFQITISNQLSDFGGDPIGSLWNQAVKPFSSYLNDKTLATDLSTITSKLNSTVQGLANKTDKESTLGVLAQKGADITNFIADQFNNGADDVGFEGTYISKAASVASRSLILQGTQFSYYAGTGTDMGTLSMKFVIFSGYDQSGSYKSVEDQVKTLKWYVVGKFVPIENAPNLVNGFAYWQIAPGGYIAGIKNIDDAQYGTLKLRVGPFYAIENLIIQSAQFNYSKTLCKRPDKGDSTQLDPLYCEVTLNLKPVTKFSGDRVFEFAHGHRLTQYRQEFEKGELQTRLSTLKGVNGSPSGINKM